MLSIIFHQIFYCNTYSSANENRFKWDARCEKQTNKQTNKQKPFFECYIFNVTFSMFNNNFWVRNGLQCWQTNTSSTHCALAKTPVMINKAVQ